MKRAIVILVCLFFIVPLFAEAEAQPGSVIEKGIASKDPLLVPMTICWAMIVSSKIPIYAISMTAEKIRTTPMGTASEIPNPSVPKNTITTPNDYTSPFLIVMSFFHSR